MPLSSLVAVMRAPLVRFTAVTVALSITTSEAFLMRPLTIVQLGVPSG